MQDEFNNPFKALKKSKSIKLKDDPDAPKRKKQALKPPPQAAQDPYDDADLFMQAMGGVKEVKKGAGRQVHNDAHLDHKPFDKLKGKKKPAPAPKPAPKKAEKPAPTKAEEKDMFFKAMGDVAPMDGKGRDVPIHKEPPKPTKAKTSDAISREHLRDLVRGDIEFKVEYTEEYMHGHVEGLDPKIFNKLRTGSYSYEAHLDLHGLNTEQALHGLVDFVKLHYQMGHRTLLIVTGRGKNSPDGRGILRDEIQNWLTKEPFRRVVLAYVTAQPKDGGPGAIYVMLRKHKKSLGKVQWDKLPKEWMFD